MRTCPDLDEGSDGVGLGRLRRCENVRGQDARGQVVAPLERAVATRRRHLTGEEEELEDPLGHRPVPPPLGPGGRVVGLERLLHLPGRDRTASRDDLADLLEHRGVLQRHLRDRSPRLRQVGALTPAEQPVGLGWDERGHVRPRLDEPAGSVPRGRVEQRRVVGTDPRERRHEVRAREHVDRVDLQDAEPVDHLLEVPHRRPRPSRRPGRVEALARAASCVGPATG